MRRVKTSPLLMVLLSLLLMSFGRCRTPGGPSNDGFDFNSVPPIGSNYRPGGSGPLTSRSPDANAINEWLGNQLSVNPTCIQSRFD